MPCCRKTSWKFTIRRWTRAPLDNHLVVTEQGMRFYAGVQLKAHNGLPIGTLCVLDDKPRTLTDLQRQTLRTLANQVMTQLELRRTLRNQEILRGEMDHRVKNSLQTVQSLIRLYAGKIKDPDALTAFAAIERRVAAIVALHRELHQSSSIAQVKMKPFLGGVLNHLSATCPDHVSIKTDIADFELASTEATALAVVASECVANAIKHAFPEDRKGEITVTLAYTPEGEVRMTCRDNGVGATEEPAKPDALTSLGLRIMDASAQQIAARVDRQSTPDGYVVDHDLSARSVLIRQIGGGNDRKELAGGSQTEPVDTIDRRVLSHLDQTVKALAIDQCLEPVADEDVGRRLPGFGISGNADRMCGIRSDTIPDVRFEDQITTCALEIDGNERRVLDRDPYLLDGVTRT